MVYDAGGGGLVYGQKSNWSSGINDEASDRSSVVEVAPSGVVQGLGETIVF